MKKGRARAREEERKRGVGGQWTQDTISKDVELCVETFY